MGRRFQSRLAGFTVQMRASPQAVAIIEGSEKYPDIQGLVRFYQTKQGVLMAAEIDGLPAPEDICKNPVFGFHIHSGNHCEGDAHDPFSEAMSHYNPNDCEHPFHAGDLPPLLGNNGYGFGTFLTNRFCMREIIGKTVIIHGNPDDFTTQPSGNSGEKLACGIIVACMKRCI